MNSGIPSFYVSELMYNGAPLAVYLVGLVAALVLWRRYPRVALLTALALAILVVVTTGQAAAHAYFFSLLTQGRGAGITSVQYAQQVGAVNLVASLGRAAGYGLLIWAVFSGREDGAGIRGGFPAIQAPPAVPWARTNER